MAGPILFPMHGHSFGRNKSGTPAIIFGMLPLPAPVYTISGITRDSTGAPLANCVVQLLRTIDDVMIEKVVSNASGFYSFSTVGLAEQYYVSAYKAGAPDVAGSTVNTLTGV